MAEHDQPKTLPRLGASDGTITAPGRITEPPDATKDRGMSIAGKAYAQYFNWYFNQIYVWFVWLSDTFDAWGRLKYEPKFQFRENWMCPITVGTVGTYHAGSPWWLGSAQIGAGNVSNIDGNANIDGNCVVPGNANADELFIGLRVNGSAGSGPGLIRTNTTTGQRAKVEWIMNVNADDNTTWYGGLIPREAVFISSKDYIGFRRVNGDTVWKCVTHLADNTETVTASAVTFTVAHRFRLEYIAGATRTVKFYIDDALIATHTTKIVADYNFGVGFGGHRNAGSLTSLMSLGPVLVDYDKPI